MNRTSWLAILFIASSSLADPWPGEAWTASTDLTTAAGWTTSTTNTSGVYWNPVTRRLWIANNSGNFRRLRENGSGDFVVDTTFTPSGAPDLEGITQADPAADRVYLMVEREDAIREYVASTGVLNRSWDITSYVGGWSDQNDGTEGIAFIPDAWLARSGFRDSAGNLYPQSVHGANGLGGIFLVGVQDIARATAGYVYAVDVKNDGTWTRVGKYKTSRGETADLAFDASVGRLYILHNTGTNFIEVTDLTSAVSGADRKFTTLREFDVPSTANIEGFTLAPSLKADSTVGDGWAFFTNDDGGTNGALRWFKQLPSTLTAGEGHGQIEPVSTTLPLAPSVIVKDAFKNNLAGFAIAFQVTSGGGSTTGASPKTDSAGIARIGSWTIGPAAGANSLSAAGAGLTPGSVSFTATGTPASALRAPRTPAASATRALRLPALSWLLGRVGL
jgi:hypothetical protein